MIWFHRIDLLPPNLIPVWEVAVIASILASGLQQVWQSMRRHTEQREAAG